MVGSLALYFISLFLLLLAVYSGIQVKKTRRRFQVLVERYMINRQMARGNASVRYKIGHQTRSEKSKTTPYI